jgi:hypothetical protein
MKPDMQAVDRLLAIEEIKILRARWCRFLDERCWQDIGALLCDDACLDLSGATPGAPVVRGASEIAAFVSARYGSDERLLHLNFMPEIEVMSSTEATGIWRQEVFLKSSFVEGVRHGHGYGTVHDCYEKCGDVWKFKSIYLKLDLVI